MRMVIYNILLPVARLVAIIMSRGNRKIARTVAARKGIRKRWFEKSEERDRDCLTVWFHVSSAGEFLQARPVMDQLSDSFHDKVRIALTFYSPSGFDYYMKHDRARRNRSIFFVDYLPFDTPAESRFCLDTLAPDLIVYTKYDIWPNLVTAASSRKIPQLLLSAAMSEGSRMFTGLTGWFFKPLYGSLSGIGAVSERDADRFAKFTDSRPEITVTGDIRFDQVVRRLDSPTADIPGSLRETQRPILVAGSTWPRDEEILIPGLSLLKERCPGILFIVAPHEPTADRVAEITTAAKRAGLASGLLSTLKDDLNGIDVLIADGVGYLAELYTVGNIAYVGGSWTSGIHNVLEPAVAGLPVLFGPRFGNAWEAQVLIDIGSAFPVNGPEDFAERLFLLIDDPALMLEAGRAGSDYIRENTGASTRSLQLIEKTLWTKSD